MDRHKIIDALALPPEGSFTITHLHLVQWGRDLIFDMHYTLSPVPDIDEPPTAFRLLFHDCREIKFRVYAHIAQHELGYIAVTAEVAELRLGQDNHRKDAHLLTNCFGLTVSYGAVLIEHNDRRYPL